MRWKILEKSQHIVVIQCTSVEKGTEMSKESGFLMHKKIEKTAIGYRPIPSPANFPRRYKATPTSRVFSRRHAATVTL